MEGHPFLWYQKHVMMANEISVLQKHFLALKYIIKLIRKTNKYVKIISKQLPTNYKQYVRKLLN